MSAAPRVLFYVQHLLGVGHVFRAMRVVSALVESGFEVDLVHGGERLPLTEDVGARTHYLPSLVSSRGDFSVLLDSNGSPATDVYKEARRDRLLTILDATDPDIVVTEAFPFGRRQMHFELLPLMKAAKARARPPMIFASIRDILQEGNKPAKDRQTVDLVNAHFDGVLVHGDRQLIALEATFPFADEIADRLHYTGIVVPKAGGAASEIFDVVVSAGGGLLGKELISAALAARPNCNLRNARWCILAGPYLGADDFRDLEALAGPNVSFRRFLPDLHRTLAAARLSISLAGYNTVADLVAAGCRAIVAPQWNDKETEQLRRAQLLSERGYVTMIGHDEKTPQAVAAAIENAMAKPPPDWSGIRTDGSQETARILKQACESRRIGSG